MPKTRAPPRPRGDFGPEHVFAVGKKKKCCVAGCKNIATDARIVSHTAPGPIFNIVLGHCGERTCAAAVCIGTGYEYWVYTQPPTYKKKHAKKFATAGKCKPNYALMRWAHARAARAQKAHDELRELMWPFRWEVLGGDDFCWGTDRAVEVDPPEELPPPYCPTPPSYSPGDDKYLLPADD